MLLGHPKQASRQEAKAPFKHRKVQPRLRPGEPHSHHRKHAVQRSATVVLVALWDTAPLLPQARDMLHGSLVGPLAKRIQEQFDVTDAELRLELVASHLIGLAFARYQLKIEPLASADPDRLAASIGATIDRYLTDPASLT